MQAASVGGGVIAFERAFDQDRKAGKAVQTTPEDGTVAPEIAVDEDRRATIRVDPSSVADRLVLLEDAVHEGGIARLARGRGDRRHRPTVAVGDVPDEGAVEDRRTAGVGDEHSCTLLRGTSVLKNQMLDEGVGPLPGDALKKGHPVPTVDRHQRRPARTGLALDGDRLAEGVDRRDGLVDTRLDPDDVAIDRGLDRSLDRRKILRNVEGVGDAPLERTTDPVQMTNRRRPP